MSARRGGVRKEERWAGFRSGLAAEIQLFIAAKRATGRKYGTDERIFRLFDAYLVAHGVGGPDELTRELLDGFLASRPAAARHYNGMLGAVQRLITWLVAQGRLRRPVLMARRRPITYQRIPFIFDPPTAKRLLKMAGDLHDAGWARRRGPTYRTLFAILYGLGLRAGEACHLRCGDVDLDRCILTVRGGKFGKTRLVPFGSKIGALLREQLDYSRKSRKGGYPEAPLFTFDGRRCVHSGNVSMTFLALTRQMRLPIPDGVAPPHLHDLRHSFAVGTLVRWYRQRIKVADRLAYLSTFMGHADPASTAVYLTITDDLLREANGRFEAFARTGARR